jgi:hypothetical protein
MNVVFEKNYGCRLGYVPMHTFRKRGILLHMMHRLSPE